MHKKESNLELFSLIDQLFWVLLHKSLVSDSHVWIFVVVYDFTLKFSGVFGRFSHRNLDVILDKSIIKKITSQDSSIMKKYLLGAALKFVTLVSMTVQKWKVFCLVCCVQEHQGNFDVVVVVLAQLLTKIFDFSKTLLYLAAILPFKSVLINRRVEICIVARKRPLMEAPLILN